MLSIAHNMLARRIVTSVLALLVAIATLPGPVSWLCMLKSGGVQCCCISVDADESVDSGASCCAQDVVLTPLKDAGLSEPGLGGSDGGEPCDCGDEGQQPVSVDPKDGGDDAAAVLFIAAGMPCVWPDLAPRHVGADHETQQRCTGPPLYVLFEVFLI